jgi:hypothetical protein
MLLQYIHYSLFVLKAKNFQTQSLNNLFTKKNNKFKAFFNRSISFQMHRIPSVFSSIVIDLYELFYY